MSSALPYILHPHNPNTSTIYAYSKNLSTTTTMITYTCAPLFRVKGWTVTSNTIWCSTDYSKSQNMTPNCTTNTKMFPVHSCFLWNWKHQVIIPSNSVCSLYHMSNQTEMLCEWIASPWGGLECMRILANIIPKFWIVRCYDDSSKSIH